MAPVNGTVGKSPKTIARLPNKPIIPALPLNFPQRPAVKKQPAAPVNTPPPEKVQNGTRPAEDNMSGAVSSQEGTNGNLTKLESISMGSQCLAKPSAPSVQAAPKPAPARGTEIPDEHDKENRIPSSTLPDRTVSTQTRPPGFPNPAPRAMGTSGPIPQSHVSVAHPPLAQRATFHQPHPSSGSMMLGNFHDSNTSSPAPRSSAGFLPPGFGSYPPTAVDAYGRPILASPAVDAFPPNLINPHGSPTPHNLPGSQSSAQADDRGFSHYPTGSGPVGQGPMPPPGMNPPMTGAIHSGPPPMPGYQNLRDQDEALSFLQHAFSDNSFHDCVLEVRFTDNPEFQDHPGYRLLHNVLRTNAHRFILSRSPMLAGLMKAQGTVPGGMIILSVKDEFMRPDVFWYSLRTLYGWSLADGVLLTELQFRDVRDDFKTALSYIATARYLQLPWVYSVAAHRASRLLHWDTIEVAVKFVSQIVAVSPTNDGHGIREVVEPVLSFLVNNFPVDFILDVNAADFGLPRFLPSYIPPHNPNAPPIANGTSGGPHSRQSSTSQAHLPRNSRASINPRLSSIKFGDIPPPKEESAGTRAPNAADSLLSRILLNLPFQLLKQILEHPQLGNLSGEFPAASRQSMITGIVAERESRRRRVLDQADPQLRRRIETRTQPLVVGQVEDYWVNNMAFKEEVFAGDLPYLVHTWPQQQDTPTSN